MAMQPKDNEKFENFDMTTQTAYDEKSQNLNTSTPQIAQTTNDTHTHTKRSKI